VLGSRFFWKLYVSYALLVVFTSAVIGLLVQQQFRASLLTEIERHLVDSTTFLAPQAARFLQRPEDPQAQRPEDSQAQRPEDPQAQRPEDSQAQRREEPQAQRPEDSQAQRPEDPQAQRPEDSQAQRREDPQAVVRELGTATGTRVTLVYPDGQVLADSHHDPARMENHASRPEIRAAYLEPYGMAQRRSRTANQEFLYVARAVRDRAGQPAGVVRAAIPLDELEARVDAARNSVVFGAVVGTMAALVVGLLVARRITAPVAEMTEVAAALQDGDYDRRVRTLPDDEFGMLGQTLNRLADELIQRIAGLSRQSGQLGAMVASMEEGVIAVDREDRVILSNRAARRVLGIESGDVRGEKLWEVARVPGLVELLTDVRDSNTPAHEQIILHREATEIALDARATPFRVDDGRGIVVVLYDITSLRRLERMRTDFVANVSHELKTPLTSIAGYVDTLLDGAIDDDEHNVRFLEKARAQVRRLESLVNDLLALAVIESPVETVSVRNVDWIPIVRDALHRRRDVLETAGLKWSMESPEDPLVVAADPESMIQILDNLLDNATRYTPTDGRVDVRLRRQGPWAVLEVEDTGIGISAADQQRIFERFFRADRARSGDEPGTGLGLSIVKHLVQRLDGEIEVESEVGRGSRFRVRLPLAD